MIQILQRLFHSFKYFFLAGIALIIFSSSAYAAPYGQCAYGSYLFNGQCHRSDPPGSSPNEPGGSTGTKTCSDQAPGSSPNLFQINTTGSTATLYFAPAAHPYDNYYVAFGDKQNSEGYGGGFQLSQTTGALKYDVYQLKPNSIYTFKVRAGNGCKAGPWSSTLAVKTGPNKSKRVNKYYPFRQAYFTRSVWARVNGVWQRIPKLFAR